MNRCEELPLKFIKCLVPESCRTDKMYLPLSFCVKYGECIPSTVTVVMRDGHEIELQFMKEFGVFVGMQRLFKSFDCRRGCILAFQFNGGDNFFVHVITSSYEIYGGMKNPEIEDGAGCKFVQIVLSNSVSTGRLRLPPKFVNRFGKHIPREVSISLKNGERFECGYNKYSNVLFGLEKIFRNCCLGFFETILFTYYGNGLFDLSVFNVQCIEKPVYHHNLLLGADPQQFEIKIQRSHLLRYSLGVYISSRFKALTDRWNTVDHIKVHHGRICFSLQIKKRGRRVEIHRGWIQLRSCLMLTPGDVCFFKRQSCDRNFKVEVYKP